MPDFGHRILSPPERLTRVEDHLVPAIEALNDHETRLDGLEDFLRRLKERACYALAALVLALWSSGRLTPDETLRALEWVVKRLLLS